MRLINTIIIILTAITIIFTASKEWHKLQDELGDLKTQVSTIQKNTDQNLRDLEVLMRLLEKSHVI